MSASKPPDGGSDSNRDPEKISVAVRSSGSPDRKMAPVTSAPPATNRAIHNPFRHQLQPPDTNSTKARPRYRQHFPGFDRAMMVVNEEEETVNDNNKNINNSIHNKDGSRRRRSVSPTHSSVTSSAVLNRSQASSSTDSGSSTLNLSIGARAALNEHLRHIARFGFDGSANNSSIHNNSHSSHINNNNNNNNNNSTSHSSGSGNAAHGRPPRSRSSTPPRNPLDVLWDTLLSEDGGANLFSPGSPSPSLIITAQKYEHERDEVLTTESFLPEGGLNLSKIEVSVSSGDIDGSEAIEVAPTALSTEETQSVVPRIEAQHPEPKDEPPPPISLYPWDHHNHHPYNGSAADCDNQSKSSKSSSSFFNSSRVEQLRTPERNFTNPGEAGVTQRNFDYAPHSPSILEESTICGSDGPGMDNIPMAHMFRAFTTGGIASSTTGRGGASSTTTSPGQKEQDASSPSPTPSFLDHSFSSFVMGANDLSRISGFGNSPDNSFQRETSFSRDNPHPSHPQAQNRPLFSSWDEEDNNNSMPLQEHSPFDRPYLEGPSPPPAPPPSRSTSQGRFYPTQNPPSAWLDTSFSSLPSQRIVQHHRSLSPPKRRPLLQKQHSCPVSGVSNDKHSSRRSDSSHHNTRYDLSSGRWHSHKPKSSAATRPLFSEVAQKAGWVALTQEREQQVHASSPPTQTLLDFFQDYALPANDSRGTENHDLDSRETHLQLQQHSNDPNLLLFSSPNHGIHITEQPSVDDISTIHNDSSSGGQQNISSSSSSNHNKQWRKAQAVGDNQPNSKPAAIATTPATAVLNRSTLSSSSSSSAIHPVDRRLYRTVVPSRVFLTEEPKEGYFPRARDSFSSDDPGRKVGKSTSDNSGSRRQQQQQDDDDEESCLLQDSFEAAHQHSLLEESRKLQQQQEEH